MISKRRVRHSTPMQFQEFIDSVSKAISVLQPAILKSSFRASGLFPFDASAVNFMKVGNEKECTTTEKPIEKTKEEIVLSGIEEHMQPHDLLCFYKIFTGQQLKVPQHLAGLYHLWKKIKEIVDVQTLNRNQHEEELIEFIPVEEFDHENPENQILSSSNIPMVEEVEQPNSEENVPKEVAGKHIDHSYCYH